MGCTTSAPAEIPTARESEVMRLRDEVAALREEIEASCKSVVPQPEKKAVEAHAPSQDAKDRQHAELLRQIHEATAAAEAAAEAASAANAEVVTLRNELQQRTEEVTTLRGEFVELKQATASAAAATEAAQVEAARCRQGSRHASRHASGGREARLSSKEPYLTPLEPRPGSMEDYLAPGDSRRSSKEQLPSMRDSRLSSKEQRPSLRDRRLASKELGRVKEVPTQAGKAQGASDGLPCTDPDSGALSPCSASAVKRCGKGTPAADDTQTLLKRAGTSGSLTKDKRISKKGSIIAGTLKVTIVEAADLRHANGKSDPYCVCQLSGKPQSKFQTRHIQESRAPVWDEEHEITDYMSGDNLVFSVFDFDLVKKADFLGRATLESSEFHDRGYDGVLHLTGCGVDGKTATLRVKVVVDLSNKRSGSKDVHHAEADPLTSAAVDELSTRAGVLKAFTEEEALDMCIKAGTQDLFVAPTNMGGCTIDKPEERGITLPQLGCLFAHIQRRCAPELWTAAKLDTPRALTPALVSCHDAVHYVAKPATKAKQCSYVELVVKGPQRPEWFASHWWGGTVADMIACLDQHTVDRRLAREQSAYWVCAYANNLWPPSGKASGLLRTSLQKAMDITNGTVSILDRGGVYFDRLWCGYEVHTALVDARIHKSNYLYDFYIAQDGASSDASHGENGRVRAIGITDGAAEGDAWAGKPSPAAAKARRERSFPTEAAAGALSWKVQASKASLSADRVHILNAIAEADRLNGTPAESHRNYELANAILRGRFAAAAWVNTLENRLPMEGLATALKSSHIRKLELSFDGGEAAPYGGAGAPPGALSGADRHTQLLARHLPAGLQELSLSFRDCQLLTDEGGIPLMDHLPEQVRVLRLDFSGTGISDASLSMMAKMLPMTMRELDLNLGFCSLVTDAGIGMLGNCLPTQLHDLRLVLRGMAALTDQSLISVAPSLSPGLRTFELDAHGCRQLTDTGFEEIAVQLPPALDGLQLGLGDTAANISEIQHLLTDCFRTKEIGKDGTELRFVFRSSMCGKTGKRQKGGRVAE